MYTTIDLCLKWVNTEDYKDDLEVRMRIQGHWAPSTWKVKYYENQYDTLMHIIIEEFCPKIETWLEMCIV